MVVIGLSSANQLKKNKLWNQLNWIRYKAFNFDLENTTFKAYDEKYQAHPVFDYEFVARIYSYVCILFLWCWKNRLNQMEYLKEHATIKYLCCFKQSLYVLKTMKPGKKVDELCAASKLLIQIISICDNTVNFPKSHHE